MKKLSFLVLAIFLLSLTGCGQGAENVDVGKWGVIELPNGDIVEGEIESLTRWSDSTFEVVIGGTTYCVHPVNFAAYDKEAQP